MAVTKIKPIKRALKKSSVFMLSFEPKGEYIGISKWAGFSSCPHEYSV